MQAPRHHWIVSPFVPLALFLQFSACMIAVSMVLAVTMVGGSELVWRWWLRRGWMRALKKPYDPN